METVMSNEAVFYLDSWFHFGSKMLDAAFENL